jgi:murein DD-endopeptidase MepM/ murein hydrolase activator NlpD
MCRTELTRVLGTALLALLASACSREEPRTVVLDPATGRPAVAPPPARAAASRPATIALPAPAPPDAPVASPSASTSPAAADAAALLAARRPLIPVEGVAPQALRDNYTQARGQGRHEAIDIMAPRGSKVFAVDDGKLVKLFKSVPGGITAYQFDPKGQLAYYYAHLDRYADGLKEGMELRRGDLVGYVGSTGNASADAPHLHFAVFRLGPERQWWKGEPVNPYPALRAGGVAPPR